MRINFAHLCDYAFMGERGKLGVIGIFDRIGGPSFPVTHPQAYLAYEVALEAAEVGQDIRWEMAVRDEDGRELARFKTKMKSEGQAPLGSTPTFRQILPIANMQFPKPGRYEFAFFLNEHYDRSIHLTVVVAPDGPPQLP